MQDDFPAALSMVAGPVLAGDFQADAIQFGAGN